MQKQYNKLHEISRHTRILQGIHSIIDWDHETYMPEGASAIRAEQNKVMAGLIHKERTSSKFSNALSKLIDIKTGAIKNADLTSSQIAALKLWRRDYLLETSLPSSFVEDFAKLTSQSILVWRSAKKENAFLQFAPFLEKIVEMVKRKADYLGYHNHPYDALLDLYEPAITTDEIHSLFTKLKKSLVLLLKKINSSSQINDQFLFGKFPQEKQLKFGEILLKGIGYDMSKGRLDLSTHPFSSAAHPTDSRITTRIHSNSLMSNISAVLHEAGHALYEMGLPIDQYGSPLGDAISLGIHESQSRWWETRIGLSKAFWQYYLPELKKVFKNELKDISLEEFYPAINKVEPSFIRVEADEVTYALHVILRFELEKTLMEGSLLIKDLPEVWNEKMQELLGITPLSNREGCLQDIHWSMGAFGYFPTYALGNLYASQFFTAFEKQFPNWEKEVQEGKLLFVKNWLSENVYRYGREFCSKDLLKKVTGKNFSADPHIQYLTKKYESIYDLKPVSRAF